MFGGCSAAVAALAEANALRGGDRAASARRVRRFAALAEGAPPLSTAMARRALAYAADAAGRRERALDHLAAAEDEARRFGQSIDAGIAAYQRGRRLGGAEGERLVSGARALLARTGASERLLDEDAGLR